MGGLTNLEIARSIPPRPTGEIVASLGIPDDERHPYGRYIAKVNARWVRERVKGRPDGRYVAVPGITSTPLSLTDDLKWRAQGNRHFESRTSATWSSPVQDID